jgi:putative Mg2+ transporter-C (MgtC) family protein
LIEFMLHDLNSYIVARLLLAGVLGGLVGLERELRHKPAGLRTNMLICFGAALFTIISYEMAGTVGGDHTRIAAQIIPGIGFIGAGVVIRGRGGVVGITSAATIFVMASVGMAVGAGMLMTAIFSSLILLVALVFLGAAEERFGLSMRLMTFRLRTEDPTVLPRAHQIGEESRIQAHRWHSHRSDEGNVVEFDADVTYPQERELMEKLAALKVHCDVRPV